MKLARFRHDGAVRWGVVDLAAGAVQPVAGTILDWGPALCRGAGWPDPAGGAVGLDAVVLLAPIEPPSTVFGVGLNYWSHLEKAGVTERPASTLGYLKPQAALVGPDAEIRYPATTAQLDFEIELVAVIGRDVTDRAGIAGSVLGWTIGNDTSARDAVSPLGGPDLFSMKALGASTPLGPWITTADELGDPDSIDVAVALRVNGEKRQSDRTSRMIWTVTELLGYVVDRVTLRAGDVLFTGTTDGVAMEDGRFLEPGDVVEAEIEGIGVLRNVVGPRPGG